MLRKVIRAALPSRLRAGLSALRARLLDVHAVKSYAQEGEDMILRRVFDGQEQGFYVDVDAHHPRRFSNTYTFYRSGWSGINIEPNPSAMRLFARDRPRDTNLQVGVASQEGSLTYYEFDEPALNTFDEQLANWRIANTPYRVMRKISVRVDRLDTLLRTHVPAARRIDFMSVDVEGLDFDVLQSNDWSVFRPQYVLAEALDTSLERALQGELFAFMKRQGYELFGKTYNTLIFRDSSGQQRVDET